MDLFDAVSTPTHPPTHTHTPTHTHPQLVPVDRKRPNSPLPEEEGDTANKRSRLQEVHKLLARVHVLLAGTIVCRTGLSS